MAREKETTAKAADLPNRRATVGDGSEDTAQQVQAKQKTRNIACAGCAGLGVLAVVIGIVVVLVWDNKDSRLYDGKPLPANVAYIGRWASDDTVAVQLSTFTIAGDKVAADFAVRNASKQPIKVLAIGRTLIGVPMDTLLTGDAVPLELMQGDQPMRVTDEKGAMWYVLNQGQPTMLAPDTSGAAPPEPIDLRPGQVQSFKFRPNALDLQSLIGALGMGALTGGMPTLSGLRLAVQLDDGNPPHAFYFMHKSAGIGGWMEKGVEKAATRGRQ